MTASVSQWQRIMLWPSAACNCLGLANRYPGDSSIMALPLPPPDQIRAKLCYDPASGLFTCATTGVVRGHKRTRRGGCPWLILLQIGRKQYPAHRVAWLLMTGIDPGLASIDHINRDPFDNRWANLRLADDFTQAANRRPRSRHPGVDFDSRSGKWRARVQLFNSRRDLGVYPTQREAVEAANAYRAQISQLVPV